MSKIFFILLAIFYLTTSACNTGKIKTMDQQHIDYDFAAAWHKTDSLEQKGLYKSALKIVNQIYSEAERFSIGDQKIKALFYKGKYSNYLEEDNLESFEKLLRKEITKSEFPDKQIFQSILAEFYDKYLNVNSWKIGKRTESTDTTNTDIQTWTTGRFIQKSNKLFNESISNSELKEIPYEKYKEIFTGAINTEKMRNNLYEILAFRALDHFKNDRNYLPKTTRTFLINNAEYFAIPVVFTGLELKSNDKNDPKYKTLKLFQELEKYNLETKDYEELLDIVLKRLDFVKSQYLRQDKDKLYLATLDKLIDKYPDYKTTAELYYKKALQYKVMGENENAAKNPKLKWKIKEARDICLKAEKDFKNTLGDAECIKLRLEIERKYLRVNSEKVNIPGENILVSVEYKNINKVYFRLLKISQDQYEKFKKQSFSQENYKYVLNNLKTIKQWSVNLPDDGDYRNHSTETDISPLKKGIYILLTSANENFDYDNNIVAIQYLHISNLAYWTRFDRAGNYIFVVDRKTGKPVENAKIKLSYQEWDRDYREQREKIFLTENTNSRGFIKYNGKDRHRNLIIRVSNDDDILDIDENIYSNNYYDQKESSHIIFFTDRAIYRPGQTVYYKGLYIHNDKEGVPSIVANKHKIKIELKDANWQKIEETIVSTNEFGTFNGSFVIPQSGLTGNMNIRETTLGNSISFKVEEYKRPKFEVKFEDYKKSYKLGDKLQLTGNATSFAGFPIQNAKVVFTVKRKVNFPYYREYYYIPSIQTGSVEISHGEISTDKNGKFTIPVDLFIDDIDLNKALPIFSFEIKADVVDMTGETHSASKTLKAGVTEVNISMNTKELVKENNPIDVNIRANNHSGQKVDAKGKLIVYKLTAPDRIFRQRFWSKPDTFIYTKEDFYKKFPYYVYKNDDDKHSWKEDKKAAEIYFDTDEKEEYKFDMSPGEYKIVLKFDDPDGRKIELEKFVSVYSEHKNPANTLLLIETGKEKYQPPAEAKIKWQSSVSGLNIYYTLWKRGANQIGKQWINIVNNKEITIKLLEEHRGGIFVGNTYVYNNRFYYDSELIDIPWTNKQLKFEYTSFRSKLYPGQEEEWRIKIKGEKAEKLTGEILAGMYDASLDKIYKKDWQKSIYYPYARGSNPNSYGFNKGQTGYISFFDYDNYDLSDYIKQYRKLNWFGFNVSSAYYGGRMLEDRVYKKSAMHRNVQLEEVAATAPAPMEMSVSDAGEKDKGTNNIPDEKEEKETDETNEKVQLRTNMNETVFFYPDIVTDKEGNFVLKFKMNDALTKWKLRLFAHTKDLKSAYGEKEIITQKELMITPNNPRFVREGDKLIFNARIDNLTENDLNGTARVELYDAETMKSLDMTFLKGARNINFNLEKKGSASVSWNMEFPKNVSNLLIYRFYAKAGDFSDAEEGFLPVLTNQKLVTESMPLWVKGTQTKDFVFKSLKNSKDKDLKNISFSIEATSHPLWLAIQALPYLKNIDNDNSISYTNALFSNLLAKKITDDNPKIKRIFERWRNATTAIDKEALLSNLSKNQELKNILLEETPWVLDAIDEEQQKRNIALLFDLNQVRSDKNRFVRKLKSIQNPDGGFPWFYRGNSSRYITQYIIETFGKMKKLGLLKNEREIDRILGKAIWFVNRDVVKQYKKLLELAKKGKLDLNKNHLGSLMIHYMYAIQFYPETKKSKDLQEAYDYYFGQAKKYWLNRPLYLKGMLALILHRGGETLTAKEILKAVKEQSIVSEELGMYWKSYHGYHWWQLPIETQSLLIEAFDEIDNDMETVNLLKIWLLKNKQTNRWKTDKATVSAIYALLFDNGGNIGETDLVKIYVANKDITKDLSKDDIQAGTGYYKKKWKGNEVNPDMSKIKIKNPNKDIAWGAVYWQYLQDLDKIETFEDTPLKIKRTLYLVKDTDKGKQMEEIRQGDILHPGDLIKVKIRLQVDREMEFVHLSDQRAATFEPLEQLSGYKWQGGLGYYQNPRDTKMNFFIDFLPRGVFVLEYPLRITQSGTFSNGIAELQSYYAPEFSSHSEGLKVKVR